jgi:pyruvate formate lyase activating enzyme
MLIGGFQKFSLIDYPGKICAIIFTQGCNFRCPYCYNVELVDPQKFGPPIPETEIFSFLEKRIGQLDAVEITGGEPTLQKDLLAFLEKIKEMGFLIKLDTNGSSPDVIREALKKKIVDYLAMDVKAPLEKYRMVTASKIDLTKIKESIQLIMESGLDYEFRTTIVESLLTNEDIIKIASLISGAKLYVLQKFVRTKTLKKEFAKEKSKTTEELEKLKHLILQHKYVNRCIVR